MTIYEYVQTNGYENSRKLFRVKRAAFSQYCTGRRLPKAQVMLRIYELSKGQVSIADQIKYFLKRQKLIARYAREGRRMPSVYSMN